MSNVSEGDLAILVKPLFSINKDRICTVEKSIPNVGVFEGKGLVWFCTFPSPVLTESGWLTFASIYDDQLRRITGPSVLEEVTTAKILEEVI